MIIFPWENLWQLSHGICSFVVSSWYKAYLCWNIHHFFFCAPLLYFLSSFSHTHTTTMIHDDLPKYNNNTKIKLNAIFGCLQHGKIWLSFHHNHHDFTLFYTFPFFLCNNKIIFHRKKGAWENLSTHFAIRFNFWNIKIHQWCVVWWMHHKYVPLFSKQMNRLCICNR